MMRADPKLEDRDVLEWILRFGMRGRRIALTLKPPKKPVSTHAVAELTDATTELLPQKRP